MSKFWKSRIVHLQQVTASLFLLLPKRLMTELKSCNLENLIYISGLCTCQDVPCFSSFGNYKQDQTKQGHTWTSRVHENILCLHQPHMAIQNWSSCQMSLVKWSSTSSKSQSACPERQGPTWSMKKVSLNSLSHNLRTASSWNPKSIVQI